jgi:hypothetical protein
VVNNKGSTKQGKKDASDSHDSLNLGDIEKIEKYLNILKQNITEQTLQIPVSIFEKNCSIFESIVKYLIEIKHQKYKDISKILKRNPSTIGVTYKNSKKKSRADYSREQGPFIDISAFSKKLTVFEAALMSLYKKDCSLRQIADYTKRDYMTVWITLRNAKNKLK